MVIPLLVQKLVFLTSKVPRQGAGQHPKTAPAEAAEVPGARPACALCPTEDSDKTGCKFLKTGKCRMKIRIGVFSATLETVIEKPGLCLPGAVALLLSVDSQSWGSVIVTNWFVR